MSNLVPLLWFAAALAVVLAAIATVSRLLACRDDRAAISMGASSEEQVTDFIQVIRSVRRAQPFIARSPLLPRTAGQHRSPAPVPMGALRAPTAPLRLVRPPLDGYVIGRRVATGRFLVGSAT